MKNQGLVLVVFCGLAESVLAQSAEPVYVPPGLPRVVKPQAPPNLSPPSSVQAPASLPGLPFNVDDELTQFRNEIRQFQSQCEDVTRNVRSTDASSDQINAEQRRQLLDLMTKVARAGARKKLEPKVVPSLPVEPRMTESLPIAARPAESELAIEVGEQSELGLASPSTAEVDGMSEDDVDLDSETDSTLEASKPLDPNHPLATGDMADAYALGKVLFRNGDFANAEKAFRKAVVEPENEMTLKYLTATCLRRQKRWRRATEMYQIVAGSDRDPVLQKLAKWQIENIRWQQESEFQLKQLREQRQSQPQPNKNAARQSTTIER